MVARLNFLDDASKVIGKADTPGDHIQRLPNPLQLSVLVKQIMLNQTLHPLTHGEMHQRQARLQMLVMADNGGVPVMSVEGGPVLPQKMIEQHVQRHSGKTTPAGRKPTALRHDPGVVVREPVHQAMIIQPPPQRFV